MIAATRAIRLGRSDFGRLPASSAVPLAAAAIISYIRENDLNQELQ
jgi:hypothetical protein